MPPTNLMEEIPNLCPHCGYGEDGTGWACTAVDVSIYGPVRAVEFNGDFATDLATHGADGTSWSVRIYCADCGTYFTPSESLYNTLVEKWAN